MFDIGVGLPTTTVKLQFQYVNQSFSTIMLYLPTKHVEISLQNMNSSNSS